MSAADTLVNRVYELQVLEELVARSGERGGALVVSGPAGIGKSLLLRVAADEARGRGMRMLSATGVQSETRLPFAGLHQLLRPVMDRSDSLVTRQRDALLAAFGMADSGAPEPFLIALAALELIAETAAETPLVILVEDAHWLDRPTADVLSFVARRLDSEPVALLVAVRDGYDTPLTRAGLRRLPVPELDDAAARALLDARVPNISVRLRERVLAAAGGTPLALLELPTILDATGQRPEVFPQPLAITTRLEQAYGAQVRDLDPRTRAVLLLAAADDAEQIDEVLAADDVMSTGAGGLEEALQPAVLAGLIDVDHAHFHFRHPLIRSAIYQSAPIVQRREAHAALATVLADQPDRHAWHRAAATTGPDEDVATEVETVAMRAQARGGSAVSLAALQRAAHLSPDPNRRGQRLLRAAELAVQLGEPGVSAKLAREADPLVTGSLDRARLSLIRLTLEPGSPGDPPKVQSLLSHGEAMLAAGDVDQALSFLHAAAMQAWWADPGEDMRLRVVEATARLPIPESDARVLSIFALTDPDGHGAVVIEQAARLAPESYSPDVTVLIGSALNLVGAFDLSAAFLDSAVRGLREQGSLGLMPPALTQQAWTAINQMNWGVAIPAAEEAARLAEEIGQPLWLAAAQTGKAMLATLRGDQVKADELNRLAESIALPLGASAVLCGIQLTRAVGALGSGRYDDAFAHLQRMFDRADPAHHHFQSTWGIGDLAEAARHSGNTDQARMILQGLESRAKTSSNPWLHVGLVYARPLLAEDADAERHFRAGLGTDLSRWPLYRGRLLLEYGTWLRRRRRAAESRVPLRTAREAFDALGAVRWAERARRELRASGEASQDRESDVWATLSPQELQIAQLAAQGLSNREIGQRLFLSHRTIGSHLYRIFPKLGIASRSHLRLLIEPPVTDA